MIPLTPHKLMMDWSNKQDVTRGIAHVWQNNAIKNIAYFDAHPEKVIGSVHKIDKHDGKAVIFVGRGRSLEKAIDMFKERDDRFTVVCTNSSLRYLLEHDVVPDFMICIDGEKGQWTFDGLPETASRVTALFAAGAYHDEVVKWPGKIMVIPYGVKKGAIQKEIRRRWGKSIPAGGNALNGSVAVFIEDTNAKIYIFVGNDLSFKEGHSFYFDQPGDRDEKAYFVMHDIYGEECYTDMPMYQYKIWLEQACNQNFPECVFINSSEGILGVDTDGTPMDIFQYVPLDIAIQRVREALDFDAMDGMEKNKVFYQLLYDKANYKPLNGAKVWSQMIESAKNGTIKITKGLDVGCGTGDGVRLARNAGFDVRGIDISNNKAIWEGNGVAEYCQQASAHSMPFSDSEFDFVYCGDVMEHIPEEYLAPTLKEILRVGTRFVFVICTAVEKAPVFTTTPVYTHISVKAADEWIDMMKACGYSIYSANIRENESEHHVVIEAVKE